MHVACEQASLSGATMVGSGVSVRLMNEVADPVLRQHLRDVLMGAQRRGDALAKAGLADDAMCPFCREAKDGFRHGWWQCPAFEH
eukprot:7605051-Lingulodinium_polyedra.AAC.1